MKQMERKLEGTVVLITGASTGSGRASAILLAQNGAKVIINYNQSESNAKETQETIESNGGTCMLCQADVTKKDEVERMVHSSIDRFGKIDVLVNNAGGAIKRLPFLELDEEVWDKTYSLNVKSMHVRN
jgi:3-oxoacyl-[acyl-carrier protein] reductase